MSAFWFSIWLLSVLMGRAESGVSRVVPPVDTPVELPVAALLEHLRTEHPVHDQTRAEVEAAELGVSAARSAYWPTLELNALYTTGFPAGIIQSGLPGTAFRSGPAAGVLLKQTIWDFERTSSKVAAARKRSDLRRGYGEVRLARAEESAFRIYFECARYRDEARVWEMLHQEFALVHSQVAKFVLSGQRSSVEEVLARSQYEDALTKLEEARLRYELERNRLRESAGLASTVDCPVLGEKTKLDVRFERALDKSPVLSALREEIALAEAETDRVSAKFAPNLFALASYGVMQNRNAGPELYSVGVGLSVPLFTGFRASREAAELRAEAEALRAKARVTERSIWESALHLEENVRAAELRIGRLQRELLIIEKAFEQAKRRYFLLRGRLVDLRETLRNLANARLRLTQAKMEAHLGRALYAVETGQLVVARKERSE